MIDTARGGQEINAQLSMKGPALQTSAYQVNVEGPNPSKISGLVVGTRFSARIMSGVGEQMREFLASDGTVVTWASNPYGTMFGQSAIPADLSNVVDIATTAGASVAVDDRGRVTAWANIPQPPTHLANVVDLAGGGDIAAGQKIYQERCVLCHGATGVGDGPGAAALNPKPRNHTDGAYMNARTDAELHDVINNGKGAMPAWKGVLTEQQINDVLRYVRSLAVPPYAG